MPTLGRPTARRVTALLVTTIVSFGVVAPPTVARADDPVASTITVTGRGWGHGRGLGQWGAFGYATGRSGGPWGYRTILDHFYGDTVAGDIRNPLAAVALLGQRGQPVLVERSAGVTVAGLSDTSRAVRVELRPDGRFDVQRATACVGQPWSAATVVDGPVRLRAVGTSGAATDVLRVCRPDGTRTGYRGELVAMSQSFDGNDEGVAQTVNLVRLDDLLRGVLPRQVPPVWAAIDGGRGMQAILAQAVASRGFAAAGDARWHDLHSGLGAQFSTCDTTACQPYAGVTAEDPVTNDAVVRTTGEVRMRGAVVVRTEFTASTGGWTAGGTFPAVPDLGDAVSDNPNRLWTTEIDRTRIEAKYALGQLQAIGVVERNGLGADGGRVLRMQLVGSAASIEVTGVEFRNAFGLRSDWFTLAGAPPRPPVEARPIDDACPVGTIPASGFADVAASSAHRFAIDCVAWWSITEGTSATTYGPKRSVTRAQMASLMVRLIEASGRTLPRDSSDAFPDDEGSVHEAAINALAALGVVRGNSDGRYEPAEPIDRAQTATLTSRALAELGVVLPSSTADAFADDTGSVHEAAINALAAEGVVTGVSAGFVEPRRPTRRDQMASLLARSLDLAVDRARIDRP